MADRIKDIHLAGCVNRINRITNSPKSYWTEEYQVGKERTTSIGHFHLDHAYGGVQLVRTMNESGGVSDVLRTGHVSKRALYDQMQAFIAGLEFRANE